MSRSPHAAALTLIAVLALTACSAGSPPEPSTASDPTPAPAAVVETEAPVESPEPTTEATEQAEADVDAVRQQCELLVQERFADRSVRLATAEDIAAIATAVTMPMLPGRATCGGVMDDGAYTHVIWVDQPLVAPELVRVFSSRGWTPADEQATGYAVSGYDEGSFVVSVAPVGVDNALSAWGSIWPGMDVTMLGFERR